MKKNENYSNGKRDKRKAIILIGFLACIAFLIFGVVAAYYSDIFKHTGELSSSTLTIDGTYTYYLNSAPTQLNKLTNLNPGDVIVVKGTVTNKGNQSAWVREKITFDSTNETLLSYLSVYNGEFTQADFVSDTDLTGYLLPVSAGTSAVSANKVINGSGAGAQVESGSGYNYLDSNTYNFSLTIYFMHSASNSTQGQTFGFTIETQALQFRNNNSSEPNDTAWGSVVAFDRENNSL